MRDAQPRHPAAAAAGFPLSLARTLALATLASLLTATLAACSPGRVPTQAELDAFAHRKIEEATTHLAAYPPRPAQALEAAEEVLAWLPDHFEAALLVSDAYFLTRHYHDSIKALRRAQERRPNDQEVLYRLARGYYWFHSYWHRGNYARARRHAQECLAQGDKYLVECSTIIRNSHLGEDAANGPSRAAYQRALDSALELLEKLPPDHAARGDLLLVIAEYHQRHLGDEARGAQFLRQAKSLVESGGDLGLRQRVAAYERDRELELILAGGAPPSGGGSSGGSGERVAASR